MAMALPPLDELHGAVASFHGLLSVLQRPLAQFVYACGAEVAAARSRHAPDASTTQAAWTIVHAALRKQLAFLRDHTATYLRAHELPHVVDDVCAVLAAQNASFYSPNASLATVRTGVAAAARLVAAVGADAHALQQAEHFKRMAGGTLTDAEHKDLTTASVDHGPDQHGCGEESNQGVDEHAHIGVAHGGAPCALAQSDATDATDNQILSDPDLHAAVAEATNLRRPAIVSNPRKTEFNGANMRKWLVGQALRAMDALPYREGQEADVGIREVVRLLEEALK